MINRYWAKALTGGTNNALDAIDPTDTDGTSTALAAGDICDVVEEDMISIYIARESAGASESVPEIIVPDNNPGNFWWELIERIPQDEGILTSLAYANTPGAF
jgi:hypothetical protein